MTRPVLRPYQQRATEAVFHAWDSGVDRVGLSAATGAGKSVIFGEIARRHLGHHRSAGPVALLAHRRELVTQAAGHFARANPDLRVETVIGSPGPAGSPRRKIALAKWRRADVLVSTVQTLASPATSHAFPDPSLVIADEAHHSPSQQWVTVMTALGCYSGTRALGVTATPFREDHRDFSDVWPVLAASIDIGWLIGHCDDGNGGERACAPGEGYLIPPRLEHLLVDGLDLSRVPTSQKSGSVDYREGALADAMSDAGAFDLVVKAVGDELAGRKGVIFAPTVESSTYLATALTAAGTPCHHVDGTMNTQRRDTLLGDFRSDRVRWLSNVNIVSEGFDIPEIDAVVLARPTRSRIFFRQAVGRALRPAPGKTEAIVLDVVGASDGHSLAGLGALTDSDVLEAVNGESLPALLERSDRERRGVRDRITAQQGEAAELRRRAEHGVAQIEETVEAFGDRLPGLREAVPPAHDIVARIYDKLDPASEKLDGKTLDDLHLLLDIVSAAVAGARRTLGGLDELKAALRTALVAVREEPGGPVATAMATGVVGTVAGDLFTTEEARDKPGTPGAAMRLKVAGQRVGKPVHDARYGWSLRTPAGHLFIPVHSNDTRTIRAHAVAVCLPSGEWLPVWWRVDEGGIDELGTVTDAATAYRRIVEAAGEGSGSVSLVNPSATWRRKPSPMGGPQRSMATRHESLPENATQGYVSDVITLGKHGRDIDALAAHVARQVAS